MEVLQALALSVGEYLQHSVPNLAEEDIVAIAAGVAAEQINMIDGEIAPSFSGELAQKYPTFIVKLMHSKRRDEPAVTVTCHKAMSEDGTSGEVLATALSLALLNAPHVRALLRAYGFVYALAQSAEPPPSAKPKVVLQ